MSKKQNSTKKVENQTSQEKDLKTSKEDPILDNNKETEQELKETPVEEAQVVDPKFREKESNDPSAEKVEKDSSEKPKTAIEKVDIAVEKLNASEEKSEKEQHKVNMMNLLEVYYAAIFFLNDIVLFADLKKLLFFYGKENDLSYKAVDEFRERNAQTYEKMHVKYYQHLSLLEEEAVKADFIKQLDLIKVNTENEFLKFKINEVIALLS